MSKAECFFGNKQVCNFCALCYGKDVKKLQIKNYELQDSMKENVLQQKSYQFASKIITLYRFLAEKKKEFVLSKQLLKSGTSVGANVEEAIGAQSRKDFISKLSIAYKEACETRYWLRLLRDSNYISVKTAENYLQDCEELCKIIGKIQITMKNTQASQL